MMRTHHAVWLNGQGLQDINEHIYVLDIMESTPNLAIQAVDQTNRDGMRMLSRYRRSREIAISFLIRHRDINRRREILDSVLDWCTDGKLTTNARSGQYADVKFTQLPTIDSSTDWTQALEVIFTSFDAYWKSDDAQTVTTTTAAGTAKEITLTPAGTAEHCYLEFEITNGNVGTMDTITIAVNGYTFTFAALGLAVNKTLICAYDDNGFLTLTVDGVSKIAKRSGDDDLILNQREVNTVTVTTQRAATVTLTARGRWK